MSAFGKILTLGIAAFSTYMNRQHEDPKLKAPAGNETGIIDTVSKAGKGVVAAGVSVVEKQRPAPIIDRSMTTAQLERSAEQLQNERLNADAAERIQWANEHEAKPEAAAPKVAESVPDAAAKVAATAAIAQASASSAAEVRSTSVSKGMGALDTIIHTAKGDLPEGEKPLRGRFNDVGIYERAQAAIAAAHAPKVEQPAPVAAAPAPVTP